MYIQVNASRLADNENYQAYRDSLGKNWGTFGRLRSQYVAFRGGRIVGIKSNKASIEKLVNSIVCPKEALIVKVGRGCYYRQNGKR